MRSMRLLVLAAVMSSTALAQTTQQAPAPPPPAYAPPQQAPTPASNPGDRNATARSPRPTDPNDCTSWARAQNPRLSAAEAKAYCQKDLQPTSPQD
jgi:hypothetical protein